MICVPRPILEQVIRDLKLGDICAQENGELLEQQSLMQAYSATQDSMIVVLRSRMQSTDSVFDVTLSTIDKLQADLAKINRKAKAKNRLLLILGTFSATSLLINIF